MQPRTLSYDFGHLVILSIFAKCLFKSISFPHFLKNWLPF
jgi:hypothetical protein